MTTQLFEHAADAIADWINGAPCTDPAYARSLANRLTALEIPDRTFVDDLGRRWEWCGGQPGTWAWRVTDAGQHLAISRVQDAMLDAYNTLTAALIGPGFTPLKSPLVSDDEVAAMLAEAAAAMPPCPRCGQQLKPGEWIVGADGTHVHCPEQLQITDKGAAVIESGLTLRQAHEIETGCTPNELCDRCRQDIDEIPETKDSAH